MGCCVSYQPQGNHTTPCGGSAGTLGSLDDSAGYFSSKRWIKKKGEKEKRGGGLVDRRGIDPVAVLAKVQGGEMLTEDELHGLPGRMFINGSSEFACLFTQQGRKGTNQDAMLVWEDFSSRHDTIFCGVFDGHGPFGHMVAKKVRDSLPLKLWSQWRTNPVEHNSPCQNGSATGSMNSEETASISLDDEWVEPLDAEEIEKLPELYPMLRQSLLKAFKLMDKELKLHPTIDCFCSGTTAVTLVKQGQDLVIGNIGDSRAVMGTRDKDNSLVAVQLTVDLKPNLPREAARIQQCKGRVFALQDEPEVARVWLPNNDSPGLAMARAFGDFCLKDYGLISIPDISYRHLTDRDEFIVLASDGVWDVLTNKEAVDIVASAPTRALAARALVDCATRAWRLKYPTSKCDDCAVVCLFLEAPSSCVQAQELKFNVSPKEPRQAVLDVPEREKVQGLELDDIHIDPPTLGDSYETGEVVEIVPASESNEQKMNERCNSTRSIADCIATKEEEEWSALEGVTRVNSLVNLPRFLAGDKRSASWRKWL